MQKEKEIVNKLQFASDVLNNKKHIRSKGGSRYFIHSVDECDENSYAHRNYGKFKALILNLNGLYIPGRGNTKQQAVLAAIQHLEDMGVVIDYGN